MSLNPEHIAPPTSPISGWDARWRLGAFFLALGSIAVLRSPESSAAGLGFALVVALVARVIVRWYRRRLLVLVLAVLPFLIVLPFSVERGERIWDWRFLSVTDEGITMAIVLAMKALSLASLSLTLVASAPIHTTLCAAGKLGAPRLLVQITLLTYRYLFLLTDELSRLRIALRVRGFRNAMTGHAYRTVGQVTGTLLVRGSDRAERVAAAMRCRGFDGRLRSMAIFRTTPADVLKFALFVAVSGGLVAWDVWG